MWFNTIRATWIPSKTKVTHAARRNTVSLLWEARRRSISTLAEVQPAKAEELEENGVKPKRLAADKGYDSNGNRGLADEFMPDNGLELSGPCPNEMPKSWDPLELLVGPASFERTYLERVSKPSHTADFAAFAPPFHEHLASSKSHGAA